MFYFVRLKITALIPNCYFLKCAGSRDSVHKATPEWLNDPSTEAEKVLGFNSKCLQKKFALVLNSPCSVFFIVAISSRMLVCKHISVSPAVYVWQGLY